MTSRWSFSMLCSLIRQQENATLLLTSRWKLGNFFYLSVSTQTNGEQFGWWSSHERIINNGSDGEEIEEFAPKLVVWKSEKKRCVNCFSSNKSYKVRFYILVSYWLHCLRKITNANCWQKNLQLIILSLTKFFLYYFDFDYFDFRSNIFIWMLWCLITTFSILEYSKDIAKESSLSKHDTTGDSFSWRKKFLTFWI